MNEQEKLEKRRAYDRGWKRQARLKNSEKAKAYGRLKYQRIRQNPERLKKHREYHNNYGKTYDKTEKRKTYRREWMKEWRKNNLEKARKQARLKYQKNRKRILKQVKAYRQRNKDKIYLADKKRAQKPQRKLSIKLRIRVYMALKKAGANKSANTEKLVGITIKELKEYIEKQFKKGMTWENHGKWHLDHILPLISFDLTNGAQQKKAFHYTNLQPLWAIENLRKGAKLSN